MSDNAIAENLADAASLQPMPDTKAVQAVESSEHHVDPTALGMNATAWVSLAMLVVIVLLIWKKVPAVIGGSLDKKIAAIRAQLDEAASLRAEAEALKAECEAKAHAADDDAEELLAHAREEADAIVTEARAEAAMLIERHAKMAEEKIAAAERTALASIRAKTAGAAAAAAAALIAEHHDEISDKGLIDQTISGLGHTRLN